MLLIFFSSLSTKNVTEMLEKMSRTHRKRFRNFCEGNWTDKGANSNITARNMQDRGVCIANRHGNWFLGLKRPLERLGNRYGAG